MIAFVFPGQGAQKVGMGKDLAAAFPLCRAAFDEADEALGEPLSALCFEGPEERLRLTENTQPAILAMHEEIRRRRLRGIKAGFIEHRYVFGAGHHRKIADGPNPNVRR